MKWLDDTTLEHLREVADWPDFSGTRYKVLEAIGQGGMGTVYRAEDRELNREVAIKVVRDPEFDADVAQRMLNEARIVAQLEHPGIVPVHDVGTLDDRRIYYVMKLVRGRRLDAFVTDNTTIGARLRLFERICETVAFAHAQGVIHRDLKPQNVMVGSFGEVLVLDWGVARSSARQPIASTPHETNKTRTGTPMNENETLTRMTAMGTTIGTPAYMPPEQALGHIDRIDERSDVYALGAMLYFLLTGRAPHSRKHLADAGDDIPPPRKVNRRVSKQINAVCMKAMHADPEHRYDSAESLRTDVARFLGGDAVNAYRERPIERLARIVSKNKAIVAMVAAYLLMRILLIIFS